MIPTLERICREGKRLVNFPGKTSFVKFFQDRGEAARLLTEKTGKVYTFVDVDGRTHPGGWDPSQDDAQ